MSKRRRVLTLDQEMILEFWRAGYSIAEIAVAMGIDEVIVRAVVKREMRENT